MAWNCNPVKMANDWNHRKEHIKESFWNPHASTPEHHDTNKPGKSEVEESLSWGQMKIELKVLKKQLWVTYQFQNELNDAKETDQFKKKSYKNVFRVLNVISAFLGLVYWRKLYLLLSEVCHEIWVKVQCKNCSYEADVH